MKRVILLSVIIILFVTGCVASEAAPANESIPVNNKQSSSIELLWEALNKIDSRLTELEKSTVGTPRSAYFGPEPSLDSRIDKLEEIVTGGGLPWQMAGVSLENRVADLEVIIKSKPWELLTRQSASIEGKVVQLERRVKQLEQELGISSWPFYP